MCVVPGPSSGKRRTAIFVAEPPELGIKCAKRDQVDACIVCGKTATSKRKPLQQPSQETSNSLAQKCEEWR